MGFYPETYAVFGMLRSHRLSARRERQISNPLFCGQSHQPVACRRRRPGYASAVASATLLQNLPSKPGRPVDGRAEKCRKRQGPRIKAHPGRVLRERVDCGIVVYKDRLIVQPNHDNAVRKHPIARMKSIALNFPGRNHPPKVTRILLPHNGFSKQSPLAAIRPPGGPGQRNRRGRRWLDDLFQVV